MASTPVNAEEVDVVVVGGGGAGLAAAIEAATVGRRVVLLEKGDALGGSTAWSVGSITATQTPHQLQAGILDSPTDHWEDIPGFAGRWRGRDNEALRKLLTDDAPETFRWLVSIGVVFFGPMPEPPHRRPRMHNVLPNAKAYIHQLSKRARKLGVEIRMQSRVVRLLTQQGTVRGVAYQSPAGERELLARGGVVLASGDYSASPELKSRYISPAAAQVDAVNPLSTGDGHRLAMELGAQILNGDVSLGPEIRFVPPPLLGMMRALPPSRLLGRLMRWSMGHLPDRILRPFILAVMTTALAPSKGLFSNGAILVNKEGDRFTDECTDPALDLAAQPGRIAYILLDADLAEKFSAWPNFISTAPGVAYAYFEDYRRNRKDICRAASSLEELARCLEMPSDRLAATVARYNGDASRAGRAPMKRTPYYALGPVKSYVVITDGGLAIDGEMAVLDAKGARIEGLYAAGSAGQGGLLLEGHGHHLGWAFTSGRIAGRQCAYRAVSRPINEGAEQRAGV